MEELRTPAQEAAEDVFFGQVVIVWARWFVILAAFSVFWVSSNVGELTFAVLLIVALMAINFFVHGRYLMERPSNPSFLLAISALDIAVITGIVLLWHPPGGLQSQFFVLYYPMVLAFAFVFAPAATLAYTAFTVAAYATACLITDPLLIGNVGEIKTLAMRLIALAAVGGLGTFYWRIQRDRRRAAATDVGSRARGTLGSEPMSRQA